MKDKLATIFIVILFIVGLIILGYPFISDFLVKINQGQAIQQYDKTAEKMDSKEVDRLIKQAVDYNNSLRGDPVQDPFVPGSGMAIPDNYNKILNVNSDGIMGYVEVPSINLKLPIYHGTSDKVLEIGSGHIYTTAFPVGGKGNRPVLTGHTGLPSAELFTNLTSVKKGDMIYVKILTKTYAYEVFDISVIKPDDLRSLAAYKDKDWLTLLTCTPYGVNTHRLLVTGERVEYVEKNSSDNLPAHLGNDTVVLPFYIDYLPLVIAALAAITFFAEKNKRRKKQYLNKK